MKKRDTPAVSLFCFDEPRLNPLEWAISKAKRFFVIRRAKVLKKYDFCAIINATINKNLTER